MYKAVLTYLLIWNYLLLLLLKIILNNISIQFLYTSYLLPSVS